jgi:hypothetical protein
VHQDSIQAVGLMYARHVEAVSISVMTAKLRLHTTRKRNVLCVPWASGVVQVPLRVYLVKLADTLVMPASTLRTMTRSLIALYVGQANTRV